MPSTSGHCALCGTFGKLTFEHIPPKCAFNNKGIFVQGHDHLVEESSPLFGKKNRSNRGFGKQSLCASCNNASGNWYVRDFCQFAQQGLRILKESESPSFIRGEYIIKPQNVLKQILMMFVAADSTGALRDVSGVVEYLMVKESTDFPTDLNIYLYSNDSFQKRMIGYSIVGDIATGNIFRWSEINYQPFGYFLTHNSPPPNDFMVKITDFKLLPYDSIRKMTMTTVYLSVSTPLTGQYDNV